MNLWVRISLYGAWFAFGAVCLIAGLVFLDHAEKKTALLYYPQMSPQARDAEYQALQAEVASPNDDPDRYFRLLHRIGILEQACRRADVEERGENEWHARGMLLQINSLQNDLVKNFSSEAARSSRFRLVSDRFVSDPGNSLTRPEYHDQRIAYCLIVFYLFSAIPFTLLHFFIRLKDLECSIPLEIIGNWKFSLWLVLWPIGLFRYPRETSLQEQLARVYRFIVFALSSAMACFAAGVAPAFAQKKDDAKASPDKTLYIDGSTQTLSAYLGLNGAVFHPAPVQWTSITFSMPKGFYAGLWNSLPLGDIHRSPNFGREIDVSIGWNGKAFGWLKLNADATHINVTPLSQLHGDVFKYAGTASHAFTITGAHSLEPFFTADRAVPVKGSAPRRGLLLHGGLREAWNPKKCFILNSSAEIMHDNGAFGFQPAYLAKASMTGNWKLRDHWTLQGPILRFSTPLTHVTDGRKTQLIFGVGLAYGH